MQRLSDPISLPDLEKRSSEFKILFAYERKDGLLAPVYNGNLSAKYINELTESET